MPVEGSAHSPHIEAYSTHGPLTLRLDQWRECTFHSWILDTKPVVSLGISMPTWACVLEESPEEMAMALCLHDVQTHGRATWSVST